MTSPLTVSVWPAPMDNVLLAGGAVLLFVRTSRLLVETLRLSVSALRFVVASSPRRA